MLGLGVSGVVIGGVSFGCLGRGRGVGRARN